VAFMARASATRSGAVRAEAWPAPRRRPQRRHPTRVRAPSDRTTRRARGWNHHARAPTAPGRANVPPGEGVEGGDRIAGREERLRPAEAASRAAGAGRSASRRNASAVVGVTRAWRRRSHASMTGRPVPAPPHTRPPPSPRARGLPRETLAHREQGARGRAPERARRRSGRRRHRETEPGLRLARTRGDAVAVVLQPRLADQQAAGTIVAPSVELGLGASTMKVALSRGSRAAAASSVSAACTAGREPEGFGAFGRDVRGGLLGRGAG